MGVAQWSSDAWIAAAAVGTVATGALGAVLRWLLKERSESPFERGWKRVAELEEEVRLLRIALHKAQRRGNDGWTISEILSLALPLPMEDRIRVVRQVKEMVERSLGVGQ